MSSPSFGSKNDVIQQTNEAYKNSFSLDFLHEWATKI